MKKMDDSLFKSQQEVYRMDKVVSGNNIAETTEGDTILMNDDKKFLLLAKHPITNYDYFLLKRVE